MREIREVTDRKDEGGREEVRGKNMETETTRDRCMAVQKWGANITKSKIIIK